MSSMLGPAPRSHTYVKAPVFPCASTALTAHPLFVVDCVVVCLCVSTTPAPRVICGHLGDLLHCTAARRLWIRRAISLSGECAELHQL